MSELYHRYARALKDAPVPALWLDLDAFEANVRWAQENAAGKKIRVATKSIRSTALLRRVLESSPVFQGLMSFTLAESLWLRAQGFTNILLGYPTTDLASLRTLAEDPREITLMVDLPAHVELLGQLGGHFNVCVDVDLSLDLPGVRFGVYRSTITNTEKLEALLGAIERTPNVALVGLMGYEAQIAGVMDKESLLMRLLKRVSIPRLRERRHVLVERARERGHHVNFVNGGGTGSLLSTTQEAAVTEVTVGSAFFCPTLFDHYQDFTLRPALGFATPVVRLPGPGMVTCLGGGYIASGAMEAIKTPAPYLPPGLRLEKNEGTGEVQTPLYNDGPVELKLGDLVFFRHAKAGEPCERFNEIHLIRGDRREGLALTYRGEGQAFL